jgi:hypothetical protein
VPPRTAARQRPAALHSLKLIAPLWRTSQAQAGRRRMIVAWRAVAMGHPQTAHGAIEAEETMSRIRTVLRSAIVLGVVAAGVSALDLLLATPAAAWCFGYGCGYRYHARPAYPAYFRRAAMPHWSMAPWQRPRPLLRTDASSAASATRMPRRSRRTVRRAARTRLAPASLRTDLVVAAAATGLVAVADPANTPPRVIRALRAATDRPKLLRPAQAPQRRERRVARPRPSPRRTQFSPRSPHV